MRVTSVVVVVVVDDVVPLVVRLLLPPSCPPRIHFTPFLLERDFLIVPFV